MLGKEKLILKLEVEVWAHHQQLESCHHQLSRNFLHSWAVKIFKQPTLTKSIKQKADPHNIYWTNHLKSLVSLLLVWTAGSLSLLMVWTAWFPVTADGLNSLVPCNCWWSEQPGSLSLLMVWTAWFLVTAVGLNSLVPCQCCWSKQPGSLSLLLVWTAWFPVSAVGLNSLVPCPNW